MNPAISKRILILAVALVASVGCDQSTKYAARSVLDPDRTYSYLGGTVRIVYAENPGAFLGIGTSLPDEVRTTLFVVVTTVLLLELTIFVLRRQYLGLAQLSAVALILGGGTGNLIDRLRNDGAVVDFVNLGIGSLRTGIFNAADVFLMLGVAIFLLAKEHNFLKD